MGSDQVNAANSAMLVAGIVLELGGMKLIAWDLPEWSDETPKECDASEGEQNDSPDHAKSECHSSDKIGSASWVGVALIVVGLALLMIVARAFT